MALSKSFVVIITLIILVILLGAIFVELQITSKPTAKLVVSDTQLYDYAIGYQDYLGVNAKITNVGKANATNIVLSIETYYKNGTESYRFSMILSQNQTVTRYFPSPLTNVTINAGQSYLVQSGNWVNYNSPEFEENLEPSLPPIPYQFINPYNGFYAHYKIILSYQSN